MSNIENRQTSFEQQVFAALQRSAELAREDAIKTDTAIVVKLGGEVVEISAAELKKQAGQKTNTR